MRSTRRTAHHGPTSIRIWGVASGGRLVISSEKLKGRRWRAACQMCAVATTDDIDNVIGLAHCPLDPAAVRRLLQVRPEACVDGLQSHRGDPR